MKLNLLVPAAAALAMIAAPVFAAATTTTKTTTKTVPAKHGHAKKTTKKTKMAATAK